MKTTKIFLLGVTTAVALTANQSPQAADATSQLAKVIQNRALVHSPRMVEQFPELAWVGLASTANTSRPDTRASQLAKISQNLALANSPRMLEQFPELAVSRQTSAASSVKPAASANELVQVMKNQSLANSPRMKERFPELR